MKRFIAAALMCLCLVMLVSCGGGGSNTAETPAAGETPANVYRVITSDESGAPVQGVMVQFCSDVMCQMGETDADGVAAFDLSEGTYYIHIYSVPEGYAEDETEYPVPETYGDVNITIRAAE